MNLNILVIKDITHSHVNKKKDNPFEVNWKVNKKLHFKSVGTDI